MDHQTDKKFNSIRFAKDFVVFPSDEVRLIKVLNLIGAKKKVLDVGCGDGFMMEKIQAQENQVEGVEVSTPAIKKARQKGLKIYDVSLSYRDWAKTIHKKFDIVWAGEIIEHIFDTDLFLENIKQVLVKKGELIISTPNVASLGRRLLLLFGGNPVLETTARKYDAGHIRYFTFDTLRKLTEEHGFKVVSMQSSVVNMSLTGRFYSKLFADLFPKLGNTIIVKAVKK